MTDSPVWTILVATLAWRHEKLRRLMACLGPQLDAAGGQVTVLALRNTAERPLGDVRQDLLEAATSEYVSFADDDDTVPGDFIARILPLLDGTDYIGWRMQAYENGIPLKPTFHSLRYQGWSDDPAGYYRDISHLNPVRRDLTAGTDFRKGWPEDRDWVAQMRGRLTAEHYIGSVMYHYWHDPSDSVQEGLRRGPVTPAEDFGPHFSWHPASTL